MPTPKPPPVAKPKNEREAQEREAALKIANAIFQGISDAAYSTRSHMPGGVNYTCFIDDVHTVRDFVNARPDWALRIVSRALDANPVEYPRAWKALDAAYRLARRWTARESCDPTYGDALQDALDRELGLSDGIHESPGEVMPLCEEKDNQLIVALVKAAIGEANVYFRSYNVDYSMHCSVPSIDIEVCGEVEGKLRVTGEKASQVARLFDVVEQTDALDKAEVELREMKRRNALLKERLDSIRNCAVPPKGC